jgi:hypothetical protein
MTATSELISTLVAAGMSAADAASLVARAAVEMTGAMTRKSAGAMRQQRYRERNKASQRDGVENAESVTNRNEASLSDARGEASQSVTKRNEPSQRYAASLSIEKKEDLRKEKRESRATQLPSGWRPDLESWTDAVARLGGEERAEYELRKYADHALEKGRVAKNWNAAWRNWAKRSVEFGARNGNSVSNSRADTGAGRATDREARYLAAMGKGAIGQLKASASAGSERTISGSPGIAGGDDPWRGSKGPH